MEYAASCQLFFESGNDIRAMVFLHYMLMGMETGQYL